MDTPDIREIAFCVCEHERHGFASRTMIMSTKKTILFSLIPVMSLFFLGEIILRVWEHHAPPHQAYPDRLTNEAYTTKPWFSEEFLIASFSQPGGWFTPKGTNLVFPKDYQDKYFTVISGIRRTTGWKHELGGSQSVKVFVVGGSTTYCSEVPDDLTWPSRLQCCLNAVETTKCARVLNYGVTSVKSNQELERLNFEIAKGNVPDICIFYDGTNDICQGVYNKDPRGYIFQTELEHKGKWYVKLERLAVVRFVCKLCREFRGAPSHLSNQSQVRKLAMETARVYERSIREAKRVCEACGADLFVFLQPSLFTIKRPLNNHEKGIERKARPGMKRCFEETFPLLQERIAILRREGTNAFDLSDVFDNNDKPIFLDFCHVESDGNEIIAKTVYQHVKERITNLCQDRWQVAAGKADDLRMRQE